jgi:ABC-type branched-subunit amino acid transport system permease subunit
MSRLSHSLGRLNGPQELGTSRTFWAAFLLILFLAAAAPQYLSRYDLLNLTGFLTNLPLALGLCLLWGFTGILSLGQAAFLGLGGYAFGVVGINFIEAHGNTYLALAIGLLVPFLFAACLGWVVFYARIKGVFVAILLFLVTLLFQTFLNQTAGPGWYIGKAHLGGNNGLGRFSADIREPPSLTLNLGDRLVEFTGSSQALFYLTLFLIVFVYLGLRWLVNSSLGHVLVAIREDPERTESLGYDVRLIQTAVFSLAALLSATSGILYVSWGNFITPDVFGVYSNILPVIWVAVSGRKSLTATAIGTLILVWLSQRLAIEGNFAFIVLGGILIAVMTLMPEGVITGIAERYERIRAGHRGRAATSSLGGDRSSRATGKMRQ